MNLTSQDCATIALTRTEEAEVHSFRLAIAQAAHVPVGETCVFSDEYLFSVLRVKNRSFSYAVTKMARIVEWRRSYDVEAIKWDDVKSQLASGNMYWYGYDFENRPILWVRAKLKDWSTMSNRRAVEVRAHVYLLELGCRRFMPPGCTTYTIVTDSAGLGVTQVDIRLMRGLLDTTHNGLIHTEGDHKSLAFDNKPWYDQNGKKNARRGQDSDDDMAEDVVPEKLSRRTLALARQQQAEEQARHNKTKEKQETPQDQAASSDESDEEEEDDDMDTDGYDDQDLVRINGEYVEEVEICEDDEEALANFMGGAAERRNLADIIMDKIFEKEARERGDMDDDSQAPMQHSKFDPKIVEVYTGVGKILQRYTSGKLPKAFKIVPSLSYWEDILWLTNPEKWSPHAMRAATRLFASNLNPKMAQRFFNIFLLEHVRQDIHENKRLNFHLYMALKKALYKPQAFFKGVIIPLCESQNCTQREAAIIGSVLSKVSVPVIHSAATLMKLASMEYSGGNSMFIRVLLNKKYSLPTRVISELSQHFLRFTSDTRKLPVLWHQSLLVFAQRYKNDIPKQYKEAMKALMKQHFHHQITPEIRRELFNEM
ncbi:hypothetical protein JM16_004228 [Phytophthora kernoviae]|uniref:CRAL-TRIO domain-containing protein n=1 Tax=Phytophthora kernoviae TaxID=325452 RepID=A0A8T0M0G2_9STRA|nr:hypothetical protein JM16_004228 [Phytophthora kernoviae]